MTDYPNYDGLKAGGFPRVGPPADWPHFGVTHRTADQQALIAQAQRNSGFSAHQVYNSTPEGLQRLRARIGPLHVVNTHMPLAAGEVAELRPKLTLTRVLGALVDLGATVGFLAFVAFLLSRAGA